jgi:chromatin structure-remodeling complex subunit RSC1/2
MPQYASSRPAPTYQQPVVQQAPVGYKALQPNEVFILSDQANAAIPPEIREQFQQDENGRILFFTAPPLNAPKLANKEDRTLGHSARYLAAKAKRDTLISAKRKAAAADATERAESAKRARVEAENKFNKDISKLSVKAMKALENQLAVTVKKDFQTLYGSEENMEQALKRLDDLARVQEVTMSKNLEREARKLKEQDGKHIPITGMTVNLEEKY